MYGVKTMNAYEVARARKMVEKKELVRMRGCFRPVNYEEHVLKYQYAACGASNQSIRLCFNCPYKYGGFDCKRYRRERRKVNTFICMPIHLTRGTYFGDQLYCEYVYEERKGARTHGRNHNTCGSRVHVSGISRAMLKEERDNASG